MTQHLPVRIPLATPSRPEYWPEARAVLVRWAAEGKAYVISEGRILDAPATLALEASEMVHGELEIWNAAVASWMSGRKRCHGDQA